MSIIHIPHKFIHELVILIEIAYCLPRNFLCGTFAFSRYLLVRSPLVVTTHLLYMTGRLVFGLSNLVTAVFLNKLIYSNLPALFLLLLFDIIDCVTDNCSRGRHSSSD